MMTGRVLHASGASGAGNCAALAHTTSDAPKILASASGLSEACTSCAVARAKRAAHSGTLAAPAPEPGTLHVDLKELVLSVGNYR